jgi:hypothetical protein
MTRGWRPRDCLAGVCGMTLRGDLRADGHATSALLRRRRKLTSPTVPYIPYRVHGPHSVAVAVGKLMAANGQSWWPAIRRAIAAIVREKFGQR